MSFINSVPRFVFSVLIIIFGIVLIMGKKKALTEEQDESH